MTATIVIPGKASGAWRGDAEDAYEAIIQMIERVVSLPGEAETAFFSIMESTGGSITTGHPEEIIALAKLYETFGDT